MDEPGFTDDLDTCDFASSFSSSWGLNSSSDMPIPES